MDAMTPVAIRVIYFIVHRPLWERMLSFIQSTLFSLCSYFLPSVLLMLIHLNNRNVCVQLFNIITTVFVSALNVRNSEVEWVREAYDVSDHRRILKMSVVEPTTNKYYVDSGYAWQTITYTRRLQQSLLQRMEKMNLW